MSNHRKFGLIVRLSFHVSDTFERLELVMILTRSGTLLVSIWIVLVALPQYSPAFAQQARSSPNAGGPVTSSQSADAWPPTNVPLQAPSATPPGDVGQSVPGLTPASNPALPGSTTLPHAGNLKREPTLRRFADLPAVTLREFRSSVPEISARAATDIFITALVKTRKFRVLERARLSEGIAQEKALNQQGMTTGQSGDVKYLAAKYLFEGTISESQTGVSETRIGVSIMGFGGGRSSTTDTIAIDVRVIDVDSGAVLDAIDIRKPIYGETTTVSGVVDGLANLITKGGTPSLGGGSDPNFESKRKDSVDQVLRACIEEAVGQIALRFATD